VQEGLTLRPLGVGDIVDRVFAIYRGRPILFLAVSAIPYLLLVLFVGAIGVGFAGSFLALAPLLAGDVEGGFPAVLAVIGDLIAFVSLVIVAALVTSLVQSAALVDAASARYMGKDSTVAASLQVGLRASFRLLVMGVVALLAFGALWGVLVVAMAVVQEWWMFLAAGLGGLVATFYMTASWMVSPAVATLEGTDPIASLRRSWRLSDGNRWRILGLMLLLIVLQVVLSSILSFVLVVSFVTDETLQIVLQQVVNLLATIAWAPVYWGTFAVLYYDLRVRKEGFDLQLAAEALPREG
jgi:hypothetical protein